MSSNSCTTRNSSTLTETLKGLRILIATFEAEGEQWPFKEFIGKFLEDQEGKADTTVIDQAISNASRPPRQQMPAPKTGGQAALAEANKQSCGIYVMDDNMADGMFNTVAS